MSSHLMPSLECWSSIGVTLRKAQEKKWLEAKRRLKWNPKTKDSLYSKVMGQSMWPLPKNKEKVVSHP